jgi:hypothetical protein
MSSHRTFIAAGWAGKNAGRKRVKLFDTTVADEYYLQVHSGGRGILLPKEVMSKCSPHIVPTANQEKERTDFARGCEPVGDGLPLRDDGAKDARG